MPISLCAGAVADDDAARRRGDLAGNVLSAAGVEEAVRAFVVACLACDLTGDLCKGLNIAVGVLCWLVYGGMSPMAGAQASARKTIALTFDDLPVSTIGQDPSAAAQTRAKEITTKILATLKKHNAPATGFVNEEKLNTPGARDARASLLEDWLNAGMGLGNHGYSHLEFSSVSLAAYRG